MIKFIIEWENHARGCIVEHKREYRFDVQIFEVYKDATGFFYEIEKPRDIGCATTQEAAISMAANNALYEMRHKPPS